MGDHGPDPGRGAAAPGSTRATRACATGLRMATRCSIPGSTMSSTYRPAPVSSRSSSIRRAGWPVHLVTPPRPGRQGRASATVAATTCVPPALNASFTAAATSPACSARHPDAP